MLRTLAWKECRELMPLAALALAGQGLFFAPRWLPIGSLWWLRGDDDKIPFLDDWLPWWILFVGAVAAIAIGFWQTSGELSRGTFQFLLHRPLARNAIFGVKLTAGTAVALTVAGIPLLGYSLWAATPGTHASPFFWGMTTSSWLSWLALPLFMLGAFLSGIRPGRWFGSRPLPLVGALLAFVVLLAPPFTPWLTLLLIAVVESLYVIAILFVAGTRDFS